MPGISQKIYSSSGSDKINGTNSGFHNSLMRNATVHCHSSNGSSISTNNDFWSRHGDDVSYNQLQKFWSELAPQARQNLLRIDKHTLFEHARKNMYCSRCNGLLLEVFLQIVMCGKSPQPDPADGHYSLGFTENHNFCDLFDPHDCQDYDKDPSLHPWGGLTSTRDGTLTLLDCYLYSTSLKDLQNVFDSACEREKEREKLYPDACGGGKRGWISLGTAGYSRGHGTREACALHTARLSVETLVDFWSSLGEETQRSLLRMKEEDFVERLMYRFDSKRFCRDCRKNVIREFKELKELKRLRRVTRCTSWFCAADTAFEYEVSDDTVHADWHQAFFDTFGTYHHFEWAIGTGEGKSDILEFENVGLSRMVRANGLDLSDLNSCHITLRAWKADGRCNELCVKAHALQDQQCVHCRLVVGDGFVTITRGESITSLFEHAEEAEAEEDDDLMDKDGSDIDGECSRPQKHAKSPELAREFLLDAATIIFKEQVEKAYREGTTRQNAHTVFVCLALKLLEERLHIACREITTLEKQTKLLEEEEKEKLDEERKERRRTKEREKKLRRKERLRGRDNRDIKCAESDLSSVVTDDLKVETKECTDEAVDAEAHEMSEVITNVEIASEILCEGESGNSKDWHASFEFDDAKNSRTNQNFSRNSNRKSADRRKVTSLSDTRTFFYKHDSRYHAHVAEPTVGNNVNKQVRGIGPKSHIKTSGGKSNEKFQCPNIRSGHRYDSRACSCNPHHEYRPRQEYITRTDPKLETTTDFLKPYYRGKYVQSVYRPENNGHPNGKKVWEPLDSLKKCDCSNSDSDSTLRSTPKIEASESSSTSSYEVADVSIQTSHVDSDMKDLAGIIPDSDSDYFPEGLARNVESCLSTRSPSDTSISVSSNSDCCSSCLSEGDNNASLSPQNMETVSPSESDESSRILDGSIGSGRCLEEQTTLKVQVQDPEKQNLSPAGNENGEEDARIWGLPQPSMNFPIFHAPPPMAYYHHQSPWAPGPASGVPISNAYLFPSAYRYGLNGNQHFMAYRPPLQPLTPALLNQHPPHMPVFRPVPHANGVKNQRAVIQKASSVDEHLEAVPAVEQSVREESGTRSCNGFSLFHFGGPVALSAGIKAAADTSSDDISSFDGNNGVKFSIF